MKSTILTCILIVITIHLNCQNVDKLELLSNKIYFQSSKKILKYFPDIIRYGDINQGDVIADVETYNAVIPTCLSLKYENIKFYLQEYSKARLNKNRIHQVKNYYQKEFNSKIKNEFDFIIGDSYKTNLPDSTFDKIIIRNTFEYISNCDLWLADLKHKLKQNGKVIVSTDNNIDCKYVIRILERNGFICIKNKRRNGCNIQIFLVGEKGEDYPNDIFDAIVSRDTARVRNFLKQGIDVNSELGDMKLINLAIAISDNLPVIKLLLDSGAIYTSEKDDLFYANALIKSSSNGWNDIISLLLNYQQNKNLDQALIYAAWLSKDIETVRLLFNNGAIITAPGTKCDLFYHTMEGGSLETLDFFLINSDSLNLHNLYEDGETLLHISTMGYNPKLLSFLIDEEGFDENAKDFAGNTVLMYAVAHGSIENIKLLVETYKVDLFIKNMHSKQAIDYAHDPEIIKYLQQKM